MSWQEQENEYAISFPHIAFEVMERTQREEAKNYERHKRKHREAQAHYEVHHFTPEKQPKWLADVNKIITLLN